MKPSRPFHQLAAVLSCLAAFPVSCNSILTKSAPVETKDLGYELVEVVGSNIPQRVVKGQRPVTAAPVVIISAEAWTEAMQKAHGTVGGRK
ncbi:MAG: hypothetical protein RLZZ15_1354 [Verrucomicrobiota bacterium]|jgi:hypothetical protein